MPVGAVYLTSETYLTCLNHALSTEKEEIMGLLLGRVVHSSSDNNNGSSYIENVVILQRSDRQADRVEISPLQLTMAAQEAENLSLKLGRPLRVLGWYHSHPHITVRPSHVDVRTQAMYQLMDPDFIGLIFSVFQQEGSDKFANASIICFQSEEGGGSVSSKEIPIHFTPHSSDSNLCLKALAEIPQTLYGEEKELYQRSANTDIIGALHNKAVYMQALSQLVECCEMPCISALRTYEKSLECKLSFLKQQKEELEKNLGK